MVRILAIESFWGGGKHFESGKEYEISEELAQDLESWGIAVKFLEENSGLTKKGKKNGNV